MLYISGLVLIILLVQSTQGLFIQATCRAGTRYCVQKNTQGTWCYSTEAVHVVATDCPGEHLELQGALNSHLKQDLSIAYYNGVDNGHLGGVDYAVNTTTGIVRLCLSNAAADGLLQTLCMNVAGDNSVDGSPYCLVTLAPPVTTDGCYVNVAATSSTTSSTKSSTTTTTSSSTSIQPTSTTDPAPISTRSSSSSTQSTTTPLPTSGASNNSAKPKSNKVTTVVVPAVLSILVFIAIGIGIIFWRRQRRLEQEMRELRQNRPRRRPDSGGRGY